MTDVAGVATALAFVCADLIYPTGMDNSLSSVTGRQTVIKRGWLMPTDMQGALSVRNNIDYVTIAICDHNFAALPEPLGRPWRYGNVVPPTVSVASNGNMATITLQENSTSSGVVGLRLFMNGAWQFIAYSVLEADSAETVAAALAALVPGAVSNEASVTFPEVTAIAGATAGVAPTYRILRRQAQEFRISVWTGDIEVRDKLCFILDGALAALSWLPTLDGGQALMTFRGARELDVMQVQGVYRRDLMTSVTFDTIENSSATQMLSGGGTWTIDVDGYVQSRNFGDLPDLGNTGSSQSEPADDVWQEESPSYGDLALNPDTFQVVSSS
jgi:hypothetical protein